MNVRIMKDVLVCGVVAFAAFGMTACHSSESSYKKAFEQARAAQQQEEAYAQQYASQETTPVEVSSVTPTTVTTVTPTTDYSNVAVRTEEVTLVNGAGLKAYSVVVGSFAMMSNAQGRQSDLANRGYSAQIVQAMVNGNPFFRVIAATFDSKDEAARCRANLMRDYDDAWLLYQK